MELTPEIFQDFITRLSYHNRGAGVNEHHTANPLFIVEKLERITGIDTQYDPEYFWADDSNEGQLTTEELQEELADWLSDGNECDPFDPEWDDKVTTNNGTKILYEKIGYVEKWEYVCSHFTREAAEAFIKRKKHDYQDLRVYVDSQYWCHEFNAIINGLISGKIGLVENI